MNFNPRSPHGERRLGQYLPRRSASGNFNPRSPHGERPASPMAPPPCATYFNPRSPHGERPQETTLEITCDRFQSTLSSRRATAHARGSAAWNTDFNPRSPHGERRIPPLPIPPGGPFQSTLSSRRATCLADRRWLRWKFQSTLSSRRATPGASEHLQTPYISIHALLTESDKGRCRCRPVRRNFNPRSPHGERPTLLTVMFVASIISIHALLTESDRWSLMWWTQRLDFNPRSPHGERHH